MAEDTAAVLEVPVSDAEEQPVLAQPENLEAPAPETPEDTAPETVEPQQQVRAIDDYSEDELREHPLVKGLMAKEGDSLRRKTENETAKRIHAQQAQVASRNTIANTVGGLIEGVRQWGEEHPGERIDPQWIAQQAMSIADSASGHYFREVTDMFSGALAARMPKDYKFSSDEIEKLQTLHEDVAARRVSPADLYDYRVELAQKAYLESQLPSLHEKWEKEFRETERAKGETDALRQNDSIRGSQPRPTVGGSPNTPVDARTMLDSLNPTDPAYKAAYREVHGIEPSW